MVIRMAFAGFRHGHIYDLYHRTTKMNGISVSAACEENNAERDNIISAQKVEITHSDVDEMLDTVDCDVVAIGDYFAKRGALIINALSRGKHVIVDKPICIREDELNEIQALSRKKKLKIGCMLDMRDVPQFIGLRKLVREGVIGEVHAVNFGGQHPLKMKSRPAWYFEPGKHGGTINDIGIHAFDAVPWITGLRFTVINSARTWNAFAKPYPHFNDAGQMMMTMENGCGVLGDVSYSLPDSLGYSLPFYWRMMLLGSNGILETSVKARDITVALDGEDEIRSEPLGEGNPGGYLKSFINDLKGNVKKGELCTESILLASRISLKVQKAADDSLHEVVL